MSKKTANPKSRQCLRWLTLPTRCLGELLLSPGLETTNPIPNISVKKRLPLLCLRLGEQQCRPLKLHQFVSLDLLGLPISAVFEPSHFSSTPFRANFSLLVLQVCRFFPLKPFSRTVRIPASNTPADWPSCACLITPLPFWDAEKTEGETWSMLNTLLHLIIPCQCAS